MAFTQHTIYNDRSNNQFLLSNNQKVSSLKCFYSFLFLFLFCTFGSSQVILPTIDYNEKKTYEIGGVNIVGAESRDRNAIKSIAKLREGGSIQIPGQEISAGIKALLKLKLFEDVIIYQDSIVNNIVYLTIELIEKPVVTRWSYKGVLKSHQEELNDLVKNIFTKGGIVSSDQKDLAALKIKEFYRGKGRLDVTVDIKEVPDEIRPNGVRLEFLVSPNSPVKIAHIEFMGNAIYTDAELRKKMKNTKDKNYLFKKSKLVTKDYKEDLQKVTNYYRKEGFKNMRIIEDSIIRLADGNLLVKIFIEEGRRHYFRSIKWKGNYLYTDEYLSNILGISKGDIYNSELLESRLKFSMDGRDISSQYLDDGYLAFDINPVEVSIVGDSVDIEMRIFEGPQFTIDNVIIKGNDRTNEHVIRRELRTRPGQKFSRSDIIRSQREIINLGYFNPEALGIENPVNPTRGTVDIIYTVEEKPSDQLELSAGYGGFNGLIGTLGVVFNNFSLANVKDRSTWSPLPQGDGQKFSVRVQSNSRFFNSSNFSFTEPWLGGKKPRSLTVGGVITAFDYSLSNGGKLKISRAFVGLGSQLKWPDDFFSSNTTLNIEQINQDGFGAFSISKGVFNNWSLKQTITRSSVNDPLYPRRGSRITLSAQITPPYSLFRDRAVYTPSEEEIAQIERDLRFEVGPAGSVTERDVQDKVNQLKDAYRFKWLEYHKWRLNAEWYYNLVDKLVVSTNIKIGIMGAYNQEIGLSPFERFELGGDGLNNQTVGLQGRDIISLRGYDPPDITGNGNSNSIGNGFEGAPIFNKYTLEFRYPLSLNPNSTIFATTWVQGGNAYTNFKEFNPFNLKRSAGFGARIFLPMFGLLGFDYGWGFDKVINENQKYGRFNIVLGFEPE